MLLIRLTLYTWRNDRQRPTVRLYYDYIIVEIHDFILILYFIHLKRMCKISAFIERQ